MSPTRHRHLCILGKGGLSELLVKTARLSTWHSPDCWRPILENMGLHVHFCFLWKVSLAPVPQPNRFPFAMSLSTLAEQRGPGKELFSSTAKQETGRESGPMCLLEDTQGISCKDSKSPNLPTKHLPREPDSMSSTQWTAKPKKWCKAGNCSEMPGSVCFPIAWFNSWQPQDSTIVLSSIVMLQVERQTQAVRGNFVHHRKEKALTE